jgi:hypothetical protein
MQWVWWRATIDMPNLGDHHCVFLSDKISPNSSHEIGVGDQLRIKLDSFFWGKNGQMARGIVCPPLPNSPYTNIFQMYNNKAHGWWVDIPPTFGGQGTFLKYVGMSLTRGLYPL